MCISLYCVVVFLAFSSAKRRVAWAFNEWLSASGEMVCLAGSRLC